jgi:Arc/MetJ family transcription regulator
MISLHMDEGGESMRTNIDIDDELMRQAIAASNAPTKKAAVEEALRLLVKLNSQASIRKWRGKIPWEGDLEASRQNRLPIERSGS